MSGLLVSDFDYDLPKELIAQTPLRDRSGGRLLLLDKSSGAVRHSMFAGFPGALRPGDCLVINNTRVIPARLRGLSSGKPVELLLLHSVDGGLWECVCKPGKRSREGDVMTFGEGLSAEVEIVKQDGNRLLRFSYDGVFHEILEKLGETPLPPYIEEKLDDPERYQTAYAKVDGSAAAPTAGLHFTEEMLDAIAASGVSVAEVTLHVGLGTFRPVKEEDVRKHHMHAEYYSIDAGQAETINRARAGGGRAVAVGTTACRTLETAARNGVIAPGSGWTDIFIYPGYEFKATDALLTNFHLPKSTLLMLVSAMAGRENVMAAYKEAVAEGYRFFSFGDAMFIN